MNWCTMRQPNWLLKLLNLLNLRKRLGLPPLKLC
jgi:hypothetical protein